MTTLIVRFVGGWMIASVAATATLVASLVILQLVSGLGSTSFSSEEMVVYGMVGIFGGVIFTAPPVLMTALLMIQLCRRTDRGHRRSAWLLGGGIAGALTSLVFITGSATTGAVGFAVWPGVLLLILAGAISMLAFRSCIAETPLMARHSQV